MAGDDRGGRSLDDGDDRRSDPPVRRAAPRPVAGPFPWRFFFLAVIVVALVAGVAMFRVPHGPTLPPERTSHVEVRPSPNVLLAIRDLARLETVTFHMERVVEVTDQQTRLWGMVSARDALLLIAVGDVVAGVDLEQLAPGDVTTDWVHHRVQIQLPPTMVFSSALDETQTRVYQRTTDTMANRREDLEERARRDAASTMRRAAVEAGILNRARSSAERQVRSLLHSLGFEDIQLSWHAEPGAPVPASAVTPHHE